MGTCSLTPLLWEPHPHAQRTLCRQGPVLSGLLRMWAGPRGLACTEGNASDSGRLPGPRVHRAATSLGSVVI